jgi:hypothetical protein
MGLDTLVIPPSCGNWVDQFKFICIEDLSAPTDGRSLLLHLKPLSCKAKWLYLSRERNIMQDPCMNLDERILSCLLTNAIYNWVSCSIAQSVEAYFELCYNQCWYDIWACAWYIDWVYAPISKDPIGSSDFRWYQPCTNTGLVGTWGNTSLVPIPTWLGPEVIPTLCKFYINFSISGTYLLHTCHPIGKFLKGTNSRISVEIFKTVNTRRTRLICLQVDVFTNQ